MTDSTSSTTPLICCFFDAALDDYEQQSREEISLLNSIFQTAEQDQLIRSIILERAMPEHLKKVIAETGDAMAIFHYVGNEATFQTLIEEWDLSRQMPNLQLFFYNFCHSSEEAHLLVQENAAPVVIGTKSNLDIAYSIRFAEQFYKYLLAGKSIRNAFDQTMNTIEIASEKGIR